MKDPTAQPPGTVPLLPGVPIGIKQFIQQTGISEPTCWRWRREGKLKATNINGRLFVMPDELARFNQRAAAGEFAKHCVNLPERCRRKAAA